MSIYSTQWMYVQQWVNVSLSIGVSTVSSTTLCFVRCTALDSVELSPGVRREMCPMTELYAVEALLLVFSSGQLRCSTVLTNSSIGRRRPQQKSVDKVYCRLLYEMQYMWRMLNLRCGHLSLS